MVQVYRKKWVIHIERITREKVNGERLPGCRGGERLSCGRSCACLCAQAVTTCIGRRPLTGRPHEKARDGWGGAAQARP